MGGPSIIGRAMRLSSHPYQFTCQIWKQSYKFYVWGSLGTLSGLKSNPGYQNVSQDSDLCLNRIEICLISFLVNF